MVTLTMTASQLAYMGGCAGFLMGVIALWIFVEIWNQVTRIIKGGSSSNGSHRVGTHRDGEADRYVYLLQAAQTLSDAAHRIRYG